MTVPPPIIPPIPTCSLCLQALHACRCGAAPTHDDIQAMPKPRTFKLHYGTPICQVCQLAAMYCMCSRMPAADMPPEDGAESSLARRVREYKGGH